LFESYAGTIGLDLDKFKKDMDGEQVKARVEADRQRGEVTWDTDYSYSVY
jgi:hypothetical protein